MITHLSLDYVICVLVETAIRFHYIITVIFLIFRFTNVLQF